MKNQIDDAIKIKLCDAIINNDEQSLLINQVIKLHYHLLELAAQK